MTDYADIKAIDQEALQADYEAGVLSLRELSAKYGLDPKKGHVQIKRLADRHSWTRDLNAQIQAKAEAKLRKAALSREQQAAPKIADAQVIEANAEAIMQVRLAHRRDILSARELGAKLRAHLEHVSANGDLYEQLGVAMFSPDEKTGRDRLNEIYRATIELPMQIKMLKDLSSAMDSLIGLEREAWSIDANKDGAEGAAGMLRNLTDAERVTRLMNLLNTARGRAAIAAPSQEDAA